MNTKPPAFLCLPKNTGGTYASVEKIFLAASLFYVCYIVAGLLAHPDWKAAVIATVSRPPPVGIRNYSQEEHHFMKRAGIAPITGRECHQSDTWPADARTASAAPAT